MTSARYGGSGWGTTPHEHVLHQELRRVRRRHEHRQLLDRRVVDLPLQRRRHERQRALASAPPAARAALEVVPHEAVEEVPDHRVVSGPATTARPVVDHLGAADLVDPHHQRHRRGARRSAPSPPPADTSTTTARNTVSERYQRPEWISSPHRSENSSALARDSATVPASPPQPARRVRTRPTECKKRVPPHHRTADPQKSSPGHPASTNIGGARLADVGAEPETSHEGRGVQGRIDRRTGGTAAQPAATPQDFVPHAPTRRRPEPRHRDHATRLPPRPARRSTAGTRHGRRRPDRIRPASRAADHGRVGVMRDVARGGSRCQRTKAPEVGNRPRHRMVHGVRPEHPERRPRPARTRAERVRCETCGDEALRAERNASLHAAVQ